MAVDRPLRFAVVGLGRIARRAVLPAFAHTEGCELAALVSGDPEKRAHLSAEYGVRRAVGYDGYEGLLASGDVDAVYVATPHHLHAEHSVAAARHGVHVLCEKPMAVTADECRLMIRAADEHDVRLMIAYRLHLDPCTLEVAERVWRGDIGTPRLFESTFGQEVEAGDFRLGPLEKGGGSVYDMGIYCINAARYLFAAEPVAVTARSASRDDARFALCDEMTGAVLEFPDERLAVFTSSFGSADVDRYRVIGTEGEIAVEPAYGYALELHYTMVVRGDVHAERTFPAGDQFAPELEHLAACVREHRTPGPDGREGLADVGVVHAIYESARRGQRVVLDPLPGP
jgi:glucose-fructose oxidoreductase